MRSREDTDYSVNVCPLFDDEEGGGGPLIAYAHSPSLAVAMSEAGKGAEAWLAAPNGDSDADERGPVCGFEIEVAAPGFPDPA